jgi:hypothetical protein
MGCYDDVLAAHTPTKHLGTTNHSVCVTGFDEAMFLAGTSSNLWNEFNITVCALLLLYSLHSSPPPYLRFLFLTPTHDV